MPKEKLSRNSQRNGACVSKSKKDETNIKTINVLTRIFCKTKKRIRKKCKSREMTHIKTFQVRGIRNKGTERRLNQIYAVTQRNDVTDITLYQHH